MDDGAFGVRLAAERAFLVNYVKKKFHCPQDVAEDAAQNTMLKAWQYRDRYEERHQLRSWLIAITWNYYCSAGRQKHRLVFTDKELHVSTPANQEDAVFLKQVLTAMRDLPPDMVDAMIFLARGEEYTETGSLLSTETGTIKSRVSRGRARLKKAVL